MLFLRLKRGKDNICRDAARFNWNTRVMGAVSQSVSLLHRDCETTSARDNRSFVTANPR
jgi:hypothetical protein